MLSAIVFGSSIGVEYIFEKNRKKKVSEAVLVTAMLLVLSMPPLTPWWIALIASIFAVLFGKEVYGGFGRNIFNPAITGRLFVYITFANVMTTGWMKPGNFGTDILSTATPLEMLRMGDNLSIRDLFFGIRPGSMGESAIWLIVIAAIYLMVTKTASWRIIISTFSSALILSSILYFFNVSGAMPPIEAVMSGSLLFVTVFMATDPVSGPKKNSSHWIYGIIIGVSAVLIRTFSLFSEGTSFAVLMGNTFASLLDQIKFNKKVKS
ncbi:MAG: Na+-transporting NADH:ubiquinone oxidoreductase subunit [Oceanotoga sp.]|jgi:Na+-transporting NADH:ubiquinone oxidoreductase subunit B|uniref:Na+-translocating ferredoxin:NAD+ oxidoreductase RnfD subunit n=2 Tax=Petrotogaceae TaxID=1643949 RepID=A0AA45HJS7_9BACT|nr:Na+-transporting NADH:ubiquinone oxidoreductase subunit [Oceanotoga sp.]PWJ96569.1 Na+-translocating ferredoxin:NAD+ oxidoreductase RnfD subunit [Oceanotoga teriensis]